MKAPPELTEYLQRNADEIQEHWVDRASRLGPGYRTRSISELQETIAQSYKANMDAMALDSAEPLNTFVEFITKLRLEAGFALSEVQKAFDLYRRIMIARLFEEPPAKWHTQAASAINSCVSYQIHRFSDKFQSMHEQAIQQHADDLEKEVAKRSQELAASQHRYRTLVEEINDGYLALDQGRIAFANKAFCAMHKAQPEQILSQPVWKFVAEEDRERVRTVYQDLLDGRDVPRSLEYERLAVDGSRGITEIRSRVVDLGEGPILIGVCRDITARVAMEAKVREHERMAYVGHLAASLSHEIRNPLATIKLNLQILSRRREAHVSDTDRLGMAVSEVSRLEGILHQLLDLAKPLSPAPKMCDVNELVCGCLEVLRPQLDQRSLKVRRCLDPNLKMLNVDSGMLEQMLFNIMLNAMDAAGQSGHITVSTSDVHGGDACSISVRDNGPGMSSEELAQIFTPFFTGKTHGTGLGLSIVKRQAEAHGGTVEVASKPGRGAKFTLLLKSLS
jgi:PAS domain S-box-containing protein